MQPRRLVARVGQQAATVEVATDGRVRVHAGVAAPTAAAPPDLAVTAHYLGHGRVQLDDATRTRLAWVVEDGDDRWVFVEGEAVRVEIERAAAGRRRPRAAGHDALTAPMPATVVRVLVSPGSLVERGAPLVILEAMKMELPLRAPHDAVVRAVHCADGDLVQPGTVLVELDETGTA